MIIYSSSIERLRSKKIKYILDIFIFIFTIFLFVFFAFFVSQEDLVFYVLFLSLYVFVFVIDFPEFLVCVNALFRCKNIIYEHIIVLKNKILCYVPENKKIYSYKDRKLHSLQIKQHNVIYFDHIIDIEFFGFRSLPAVQIGKHLYMHYRGSRHLYEIPPIISLVTFNEKYIIPLDFMTLIEILNFLRQIKEHLTFNNNVVLKIDNMLSFYGDIFDKYERQKNKTKKNK